MAAKMEFNSSRVESLHNRKLIGKVLASSAEVLERLQVDDSDIPWQQKALCAQTDPEAFFPEKGGSTREAKKTCLSCEVRSECLQYALDNDERHGVWGGLTERERRMLKKRAL